MATDKRSALRSRITRELGRELTTATLFLHTLIAGKVGLNVTDTRCLEILSRPGGGPMTAGALTRATGLTTGAITGVLDRLEKAGFAERVRDVDDRRKLFVRPLPAAATLARFYAGLGAEMDRLASRYTTEQLDLISGFLEANLGILQREIGKLRSRTAASNETSNDAATGAESRE